MVKYDKLWRTIEDKEITQYILVREYNISKSLLYGLRDNQGVDINIIDTLCNILGCGIKDIATYYNNEE